MVELDQYKYQWNQYKDSVKELEASFNIEVKQRTVRRNRGFNGGTGFLGECGKIPKTYKRTEAVKKQP